MVDLDGDRITPLWGEDTVLDEQLRRLPYAPTAPVESACGESSHLCLGHRRLSIVDLSSAGHQPMCDGSGRYWIIYNGEIYNYREIARELKASGHTFNDHSDTAVLLHAYMAWGEDCLSRLNGMFAFAIYDHRRREVFLARDRIGIKPLYYTIQNDQFIFGSDIKTLLASGLYSPRINWEGLWCNLTLSTAPRPLTVFQDVYALPQAHWMKIRLDDGRIVKQRYWEIPIGTQDRGMREEEAVEWLEQELKRSIRYRLIADVEVGTFMSGGIDSTTVSAIASELQPGIKAFTLAFEDLPEFDELQQAEATARMHRMEHIVKIIRAEEVIAHLEEMVLGYEEPFRSLSPNYMIARLVAEHGIKVVLNGLGGDELFAGYPWFRWVTPWNRLRRMAFFLRLLPNHLHPRLEKLKALIGASTIEAFYLAAHGSFEDAEKRRLFQNSGELCTLSTFSRCYQPSGKRFADLIEAISYYDLMSYIGNHHVYRIDQFTMAFSIEGRLPYLDHHLVELAFRIPSRYKIRNGEQKYVLRKVARKYIAPGCLTMQKKGFRLPIQHWMQTEFRELVEDSLARLKRRNIFNNAEIDRLYRYYRKYDGPRNQTYKKIWQLVMLELWFQKIMDASLAPTTQPIA